MTSIRCLQPKALATRTRKWPRVELAESVRHDFKRPHAPEEEESYCMPLDRRMLKTWVYLRVHLAKGLR